MNTTPIGLVRVAPSGSVDDYGNETDTTTVTVVRGLWTPGSSSETATSTQDQVVTSPTVYLPAVDLSAVDHVIPDIVVEDVNADPLVAVLDDAGLPQGTRYEVNGDPKLAGVSPWSTWRPPFPLEVPLRRVTG